MYPNFSDDHFHKLDTCLTQSSQACTLHFAVRAPAIPLWVQNPLTTHLSLWAEPFHSTDTMDGFVILGSPCPLVSGTPSLQALFWLVGRSSFPARLCFFQQLSVHDPSMVPFSCHSNNLNLYLDARIFLRASNFQIQLFVIYFHSKIQTA